MVPVPDGHMVVTGRSREIQGRYTVRADHIAIALHQARAGIHHDRRVHLVAKFHQHPIHDRIRTCYREHRGIVHGIAPFSGPEQAKTREGLHQGDQPQLPQVIVHEPRTGIIGPLQQDPGLDRQGRHRIEQFDGVQGHVAREPGPGNSPQAETDHLTAPCGKVHKQRVPLVALVAHDRGHHIKDPTGPWIQVNVQLAHIAAEHVVARSQEGLDRAPQVEAWALEHGRPSGAATTGLQVEVLPLRRAGQQVGGGACVR